MDNSLRQKTLFQVLFIMIVLQVILFIMKHFIFMFIERTDYSDHIASMVSMAILTVIILILSSKKELTLSFFPKHFSLIYIVVSVLFFALIFSTPIITKDRSFQSILLLLYSSIVTPIYEELIFRGYVWNKLSNVFSKEYQVYIIDSILFAVWHLGYIDSIAFRTNSGLANAMFWKVVTGLCFGIVLGAIRMKNKNCYSSFLLHGALNVFGR